MKGKTKLIGVFSLLLIGALLMSLCPLRAAAAEETQETIEKIYCNATLEDDFADNEILIVLMPEYNTKAYTATDFSEIDCTELEELSINVKPGALGKIFLLTIPGHSKQNVLDAIKLLEKRPDIYSAEPNHISHLEDGSVTDSGYSEKDSLHLKKDIKKSFQTSPSDAVIHFYHVSMPSAFLEIKDIEEILESDAMIQDYCATKIPDGTWIVQAKIDGRIKPVEMLENTHALDACLSGDTVKNIASDVEVYNTYYLSGEASHMGTVIYYETNKGDYVHYFGGKYTPGEFLLPVGVFRELHTAIQEEFSKNPPDNNIEKKWDLSAYKLNSDTFDLNAKSPWQKQEEDAQKQKQLLLWIGIPAGACLLVAGTVLAVIRHRKPKTK